MKFKTTNVPAKFSDWWLKRKHRSSASLSFVRKLYWRLMDPPRTKPGTRKMFPFDDVIMMKRIPHFGLLQIIVMPLTSHHLVVAYIYSDRDGSSLVILTISMTSAVCDISLRVTSKSCNDGKGRGFVLQHHVNGVLSPANSVSFLKHEFCGWL